MLSPPLWFKDLASPPGMSRILLWLGLTNPPSSCLVRVGVIPCYERGFVKQEFDSQVLEVLPTGVFEEAPYLLSELSPIRNDVISIDPGFSVLDS